MQNPQMQSAWHRGFCALCGLLLVVIAASAQAAPASQADLAAQKELVQTKLDALKDANQKDIENLRQRDDGLDKRVDDQLAQTGQAVDRFGVIATFLGMVLTGLGVLGWRNAKSESKQAAVEESKRWFEQHSKELTEKIQQLEQHAQSAHTNIAAHEKGVADRADQAKDAIARTQDGIGRTPSDSPHTASPEDVDAIQEQAMLIMGRPEESYSFDDWNTRAFAANNANRLEEAAYFWLKASQVPNTGANHVAQSLFNRGVAQGQLKQHEAEIASYDEVIRRYGDDPAIALREQVAIALINKGIAQSNLNQPEAALASYEEVIRRYGDDPTPALREPVVRALNGIGFTLLCQAKAGWRQGRGRADTLLDKARQYLDRGVALMPESDGSILGNRAYVRWLKGNTTGAEDDFRAGLAAKKNSGEWLYKATLTDIDISPIAEDDGMRQLVERLWQAWQQK